MGYLFKERLDSISKENFLGHERFYNYSFTFLTDVSTKFSQSFETKERKCTPHLSGNFKVTCMQLHFIAVFNFLL